MQLLIRFAPFPQTLADVGRAVTVWREPGRSHLRELSAACQGNGGAKQYEAGKATTLTVSQRWENASLSDTRFWCQILHQGKVSPWRVGFSRWQGGNERKEE